MGRRRTKNLHLPPLMRMHGACYYYGRREIPLGSDFQQALRKYAELHGAIADEAPTKFRHAVKAYRESEEFKSRATTTQRGYSRQLIVLDKVFGDLEFTEILPIHIRQYLKKHRAKVSASREKALFSVVWNFARGENITTAANPCAGIHGVMSKRKRYVTDAELTAVLKQADQPTRDFIELLYYTGQDASVVLKLTRADIHDGELWARRTKTGEAARITIEAGLARVIKRVTSYPVASMYLVRDQKGQCFSLWAIRKRFWHARRAAGQDWQLRDLRAKAATDSVSIEAANRLLAHSAMSTTDGYRRQHAGRTAKPPRQIK